MIGRIGPIYLLIVLVSWASAQTSIIQTKHNLSASGPGPVRAVSEQRVCIFCHTPHGSRDVAPLWNRRDSNTSYIPYNSPTLKAQVGQPTGASKLCLSCHDGTIAMGDLISETQPIQMSGSQTIPPGRGLIGTDLSDDHPISFNYFESFSQLSARLTAPGTWDLRVHLDSNSDVQCTTCHDPHNDQWGSFMVMDNNEAALCRVCHRYDHFDQTAHSQSTAQWSGTGTNPWPHTNYRDVRSNACLNCHTAHHAGGKEELVTYAMEENVCFVCHNGSVASFSVQAVFNKNYHHPVEQTQGVHQDGESALAAADHVECVDCHNPHRAHHAPTIAPNIMGAMEGVTGVDANGSPIAEAIFEYQVCFKCHAENASPPVDALTRAVISTNMIKDFATNNPSYHPVEAPGRNADVPSLIAPLNPASVIYCIDCHNSDTASPSVPGSSGPHGSSNQYMLVREYRTGDNVTQSATVYALCYGCHNQASILANVTFKLHSFHIVDKQAPCSVCHDPHGVDGTRAPAGSGQHLVNFDTAVVTPDPVQHRIEYISTGPRSGECFLTCHGIPHVGLSY